MFKIKDSMKILWFSLSPCSSIERYHLEHIEQGWMISLEKEIKKISEIQLSVCYLSDNEYDDFIYDNVHYYPIPKLSYSKNPILRVFKRLISPDRLDRLILPYLLEVVYKSSPDLIHIHGTEESFGLISEKIKNIPIVYSIQGLRTVCCEKYFSGFSKSDILKHESLKSKCTFLSTGYVFKIWQQNARREIRYLKNASYVIGRTFWDQNITHLFNPNVKYFPCEEILRTAFYENQWSKPEHSYLQLISTISTGAYKGIDTLLKAAAFLKEFSNVDFRWVVVGIDENDEWYKLAKKIYNITAESCNIILTGRKKSKQLAKLLLESDIYCHVSHIENSPNSVCEAMILGMPVIATFAGGTSSLLKDNVEGVLVQDGDPYVLAGTILNMYEHFDLAVEMGKKARLRSIQRHDIKNITANIIKIYKTILNEKI